MGDELQTASVTALSARLSVAAAGDEVRHPGTGRGAEDQTFRLIVRPDLWGRRPACASPMLSAPSPLLSTACSSDCRGRPVSFRARTGRFAFKGQEALSVPPGSWLGAILSRCLSSQTRLAPSPAASLR